LLSIVIAGVYAVVVQQLFTLWQVISDRAGMTDMTSDSISTDDLYRRLRLIDSRSAETIHPKDRRKISRQVCSVNKFVAAIIFKFA